LWPSDAGLRRPPEEVTRPPESTAPDGPSPPALPPDLMAPPESLPPPERGSAFPGGASPIVRLTAARSSRSWPTRAVETAPQELPKTDAGAAVVGAPSFPTGGNDRTWPVRPAASENDETTALPVALPQ